MSSVEFWLLLFTANLPFWVCWIVYDKTLVNPQKFDLTKQQNKYFFYKTNSIPYKMHKRKWKKYYFLPILACCFFSIIVAWLSSFRNLELSLVIGFVSAFVTINMVITKEQPEVRRMEKEVMRIYTEEQNELYDELYKKDK